jgi:excisionase family DNA binding protein
MPMNSKDTPAIKEEFATLITSAETCEYLKISRPTLHRYVRRKLLNPFRLPGGRLRFSKSDVVLILALS